MGGGGLTHRRLDFIVVVVMWQRLSEWKMWQSLLRRGRGWSGLHLVMAAAHKSYAYIYIHIYVQYIHRVYVCVYVISAHSSIKPYVYI